MKHIAIWLLALGAALGPAYVSAQDANDAQQADIEAPWLAFMKKADANADAKLALQELLDYQASVARAFEEANNDPKKIEAIKAEYPPPLDLGVYLVADQDDDNLLSLDEWKLACNTGLVGKGSIQEHLSKADVEIWTKHAAEREWPRMLMGLDDDKDGKVARAELTGKGTEEQITQLLTRFDVDGDDVITKQEFVARNIEASVAEWEKRNAAKEEQKP